MKHRSVTDVRAVGPGSVASRRVDDQVNLAFRNERHGVLTGLFTDLGDNPIDGNTQL